MIGRARSWGALPGEVSGKFSLVARMEERLGTRADVLSEGQGCFESMLDRLVMLYLLHTPEVAPQLHAGAAASANRRYGRYWQAVDGLLSGMSHEPEVR
jgi:hypothetical protein